MKTLGYILFGILVGLLAAGLLYLTVRGPAGQPVTLQPSETPAPIVIYVSGGVQRPGVYSLPRDSRVSDAILVAGGMSDGADLSQVNLADPLQDGEKVVIPGGSTTATPVFTLGGSGLLETPTPYAGQLININTADATLLTTLPGIGPTTAQKIVQYRQDNGAFQQVEDLLKIPGIGPSTLDEIRGLITVGP